MIGVSGKYPLVLVISFSVTFSMQVFSASADILDINEIDNADVSAMFNDTEVFNTISMGIALSIAMCDGSEICDPTVNEDEIEQLIEALDSRIGSIVTRQQNSEEELTPVITAYVDAKEKYTDYLQMLSKISRVEPAQDEFTEEEAPFFGGDTLNEDDYAIFADAEEDIEDDVDLDEVEADMEDDADLYKVEEEIIKDE